MLAATSFVASAGIGVHLTLWFTVFQQQVPERAQSRVSSYDTLGSFVLVPLGLALVGPVVAVRGAGGDALALARDHARELGRASSHCPPSGRSAAARSSRNRSSTHASLRWPHERTQPARSRPHGPEPDGLPPHRQSPHLPLQLALRARAGRRVPAPDREHRRLARGRRGASSRSSARSRGSGSTGTRDDLPARPDRALPDEARRLVEQGAAYEDEGAIRFRMPDEGMTGWDDAVRGRIEFPNAELEDRRARSLRRPPDLQLRLAGRGLAGRDHARDSGQRPRLEHAQADPDPRPRSAPSSPSTRTRR